MSSWKEAARRWLFLGGAFTAAVAFAFLLWFALWAPGLEWPSIPDRQPQGAPHGFSMGRGAGCDASSLNGLGLPARKIRLEECALSAEKLRFEQETLNQSIRATNAAEESVRVAYQQVRIDYVQSAVTVLALLLTGLAAWAAASAARTANRALDQAETASRDELRAYVHIDGAELRWGDPQGSDPSITLFAKNSGQTPAKWFGARTTVILGLIDETEVAQPFSKLHQLDQKMHRWSALAGGMELSFSGGSRYAAELKKALVEQLVINVVGVVQYETIFGEIFESEFWFVCRPLHRFKGLRPKNAQPGVAIFGTGSEVPASMQRAARVLQTYRRVQISELPKTK